LQPAEALLLLNRQGPPLAALAGRALQELPADQAQQRAVLGIHRHNRVQEAPAATLRAHRRGVLDRQSMPTHAARRRAPRRLGQHLLNRHGIVAQEPRQPDLPCTVPAKPPHHNRTPASLNQPGQQEDARLVQTLVLKHAQPCHHRTCPNPNTRTESAFHPRCNHDV